MTGRQPYQAPSVEALVLMKVDPDYDPFEPIADLALPDAVIHFLKRAMALEPDARHRTVETFRADMNTALDALDAGREEGASPPAAVRGTAGHAETPPRVGREVGARSEPASGLRRAPTDDVRQQPTGRAWARPWMLGMALALVVGIVWFVVRSPADETPEDFGAELSMRIDRLARAIDLYRVKHDRFPESLQAIADDGLVARERLADPWKRDFAYESLGQGVRVCSLGLDGARNTVDDICYRSRGASLVPEL
jgi:hypothetical protein